MSKKVRLYRRHMMIPDTQVHPGVPTDHLLAAGNYAAAHRPDVIVHIGDHWDMASLSSYDRGKKEFEGRRYQDDVEAGIAAMELFLKPINELNSRLKQQRRKQYKPRLVFTMGNHENRINRAVSADAILEGKLGTQDLCLDKMGFEVYNFLEVAEIDGILYSHFFPRSASGKVMQDRRGAPNAKVQVQREMQSCSSGHTQGLDWHVHQTGTRRIYGLMAGSFYQHEEGYLTPQGTAYWRGVIMKNEVRNGEYDPMMLSLEYLMRNWL